jgi:hypothetical protein
MQNVQIHTFGPDFALEARLGSNYPR